MRYANYRKLKCAQMVYNSKVDVNLKVPTFYEASYLRNVEINHCTKQRNEPNFVELDT